MSGVQVGPAYRPVTGDVLDYDDVMAKFDDMMDWLARTYVHAMNCIHYSHDRYNYERLMMALHDRDIVRTMAFGIAGLSVVADSLSAIKYAKVKPIRDENGLVVDYETTGEFPVFGNNDPRVDDIAVDLVKRFMDYLRQHPTYRGAIHTQSVLTITSNVVYGKGTGNTPDGRRKGEPFAPGANPMHGRDSHGWLASCLSVARLPYDDAQDGISYTLSVVPAETRQGKAEAITRAVDALDMYLRAGRVPHEPQRPQQGDAARRDGAPGQVPAAHHPGVGVCGELHPPHARAAAWTSSAAPSSTGRSDMATPDLAAAAATDVPEGSRHDFRHDLSPDAPELENYSEGDGAFGYVHSYETGSRLDGPGIRVTLFLSGCPLRCQYCHNPDTWKLKHGLRIPLERVVTRLGHFAPALRAMQGGLTISGGEPLVQPAFSRRIFAAAKAYGLHTALDTSGFLGDRATDEYLQSVDLVLLDIKSWDPETYRRVTKQEVAPTLRFAERLAAMGKPVWVRYVLVPGLTDDPANVEGVAKFVAPMKNVEWVEVLPFHQLGAFKWKELGLEVRARRYASGGPRAPRPGARAVPRRRLQRAVDQRRRHHGTSSGRCSSNSR